MTLAYLGFWLGFAMLCSVLFRAQRPSVLAAIGVWIILTIFVCHGRSDRRLSSRPCRPTRPSTSRSPTPSSSSSSARISPCTLYIRGVGLPPRSDDPDRRHRRRSTRPTISGPSRRSCRVDQSLLLAWPQVVALIALSVGCFGLAYVSFMRQEVRA